MAEPVGINEELEAFFLTEEPQTSLGYLANFCSFNFCIKREWLKNLPFSISQPKIDIKVLEILRLKKQELYQRFWSQGRSYVALSIALFVVFDLLRFMVG